MTSIAERLERPAEPDDLAACEATWRDALNDYLVPLGQYEIPPDNPGVRALHRHTLTTDPDRFWVSVAGDRGSRPARADGIGADAVGARGERIVGFASAVRRGPVWFLSMLFVRPGQQAMGTGRRLIHQVLPPAGEDTVLATVTDGAQPISNGLYGSLGIVPRVPMFNLVGRPDRAGELPQLPGGVTAARMPSGTAPEDGPSPGLLAEIDALDREVLGFAHPEDHAFVRTSDKVGFTYRDGAGTLLGYGYAGTVGRLGPLAVRDPALHAAVVGHLLRAVPPRGASAIWVPGAAGPTFGALVRSGLRIEGFPVLLCWSRPFADFRRYLPISPGLL